MIPPLFASRRLATLAVLAVLAAFTAACATSPAPYVPAESGRPGYAEQIIEQNRYRVSYRGDARTDRETVELYLLYRMAELTHQRGYDYFIVERQDTDKSTTYRSSMRAYPRSSFFYTAHGYRWAHHGVGFTLGTEPLRPIERFEAYAMIQMFRGEKPADDPHAYNAREVLENLAHRIRR
jgi:hypothetical protein